MPLSTLACTIDATGISAPSYEEIYSSLQESVRAIYGSDVAITPDTQDGQFLAIIAQAIHDTNQANIAVYQSTRPSFAQGVALDAMSKVYGIRRAVPSHSVADGNLIGAANTVVTNGVVEDLNGNKWDLPETVTIPETGSITVTVTAQEEGAIAAPVGTINVIVTPVIGWQEFASIEDALPGSPVETDASLRRRGTTAASLTANSNNAGLLAALEDVDTVTRVRVYENDSGGVDANGFVAHSIAVVIEGGNLLDIATTIGQKKTPGCNLNGDVIQSYTDPLTQQNYNIPFYRLTAKAITINITVDSGDGWNDTVKEKLKQALVDYVNGLDIGADVEFLRLYPPAFLNGDPDNMTYAVTGLQVNGGVINVVVDFDEVATMTTADVTVTVV